MKSSALLLLSSLTLTLSSPLTRRQSQSQSQLLPTVIETNYDGQCIYPQPTDVDLEDYLGRWYQVAGTRAPFTQNCTCTTAQYTLAANSTVTVRNSCQRDDQEVTITGTATPLDEDLGYGDEGVFRVEFPGVPSGAGGCPGPNYIVQAFDDDEDGWAIVQSGNFSNMFLLSRVRNPGQTRIDRWLRRAGRLGTNLDDVEQISQTGCLFA